MQDFFAGLFDLSFKKLITPKVVQVVYVIAVIAAALNSMVVLKTSPTFTGLVMAIVGFVVSVVAARVLIEVALSVFQIARYTGEIARRGREAAADAPTHSTTTPGDSRL